MTHVVVRPFEAAGIPRIAGEVVDATMWRTTATLVDKRYLAPLLPTHSPVSCHCGRAWLDPDQADRHCGAPAPEKGKGNPKTKTPA